MIRAALAIVLGCAALAASAELYKWVDEKGVTQYSEQPPPDGKAKKLDITPSGPVRTAPDWKQRELESRKRRAEGDIASEKRQAADTAARRQVCQNAARQLDVLQRQQPVYSFNDRGEKVYLDDKDRPSEIAFWKGEVARNCDR